MLSQITEDRMDEGRSVHNESIIVEGNHYGPWIYSDRMMQTADRLLASSTYPPASLG